MRHDTIKFSIFFYLRRFLLALTVVMLRWILVGQFFVLVMASVFQIIFVGLIKPMKDQSHNQKEMFNELLTIMIYYHIFCFTDFVADADTKDTFVGITMVGLTFVNMGVNLIPLTFQSLNLVLSKARKRYIKIKHLRKKRVYKQRKLKKERLIIEFDKERQIL